MNEKVNVYLLARDKFMPETGSRHPGFTRVIVDHLLKTKKECKSLKK